MFMAKKGRGIRGTCKIFNVQIKCYTIILFITKNAC